MVTYMSDIFCYLEDHPRNAGVFTPSLSGKKDKSRIYDSISQWHWEAWIPLAEEGQSACG